MTLLKVTWLVFWHFAQPCWIALWTLLSALGYPR